MNKTTPLVDWDRLRIPEVCVWSARMYGIQSACPEAEERARALLLAHLDEQQRADYLRLRKFATRGASGVVYVLGPELYPTSVDAGGKAHERFCAPPHRIHFNYRTSQHEMPMEDLVLTWKLYIEGDEPGFLSVAMSTELRGY